MDIFGIFLMIYTGLGILLVAVAAACNSVMDTVDHHQGESIFSKMKNKKWWNQKQGWKNKYIDYDGDIRHGIKPRRVKWSFLGIKFNKPVQLTDSWHFFKMLMIVSMCTAIPIFPFGIFYLEYTGVGWFNMIWVFLLVVLMLGIVWNFTFSYTYERLFILKEHRD